MVIFPPGEPDTVIARLNAAISSFDKEWAAKCAPAEEEKIQKLAEIVKKHHWELPDAYLRYLRAMGNNDDGLIDGDWGEIGIDEVLELYDLDETDPDLERGFFEFSHYWLGSHFFFNLSGEEPQVVVDVSQDSNGEYGTDSFEKYLFQQAFRRYQKTFEYRIYDSNSLCKHEEKGKKAECETCLLCKDADERMALEKQLAKSYGLEGAWFSDRMNFFWYSEKCVGNQCGKQILDSVFIP